jgi:hypothetical protein
MPMPVSSQIRLKRNMLLVDTTADNFFKLMSMPVSSQIRLKRNMELAVSSDSNTIENALSLGKGIVNLEALQVLTIRSLLVVLQVAMRV